MIRRGKHSTNYVVIPNSVFEHPDLDCATAGLLGFLLSRPPGWETRHDHLRKHKKLSRRALDRMIDKLLETGFATRTEQMRDERNRFCGYDYTIFDTPQSVPVAHSEHRKSTEPVHAPRCPVVSTGRISNERINTGGGGGRGVIGRDANALAAELLPIVGIDPTFPPPGWCGLALQVQAWLDDGATADVIRSAFQKASAGRAEAPNTPAYFSKAIAREKAIAAEPLPKVSTNAASTPRGRRNGTSVLAYLQQKRSSAKSGQPPES